MPEWSIAAARRFLNRRRHLFCRPASRRGPGCGSGRARVLVSAVGVALQRWGEPRFTADADIAVLVEPGEELQVNEWHRCRVASESTRAVLIRGFESLSVNGLDLAERGGDSNPRTGRPVAGFQDRPQHCLTLHIASTTRCFCVHSRWGAISRNEALCDRIATWRARCDAACRLARTRSAVSTGVQIDTLISMITMQSLIASSGGGHGEHHDSQS
jgi:hypothetical protein